jgi:ADP-ribose pyrophosphatase YjhB (NUDIX family)
MSKICDHTSVGVIVINDGKALLMEGRLPPYGVIIPAGHMDQDINPVSAALRELKEETGLHTTATKMILIFTGLVNNNCGRGGSYHHWHLYITYSPHGELKLCTRETQGYNWCDKKTLSEIIAGKPLITNSGRKSYLSPEMRNWFTEINLTSYLA